MLSFTDREAIVCRPQGDRLPSARRSFVVRKTIGYRTQDGDRIIIFRYCEALNNALPLQQPKWLNK